MHGIEDFIVTDPESILILEKYYSGLRPVPRITVSEWANTYRMLDSASSSEPGKYRYERTPYLRKVMDYLSKTSDIEKVVVMKGVQLGFTDAGNNWIGYTIDIDPGPMLLVMPTEALLKKNSRTRLEPMIENTPELKKKTGKKGTKDSVNTILEKEFPGGFLMMVAAQSPSGLSSTPVGKIFLDEVDRYPDSAGKEGSPIELAEARASTFSNRKLYLVSTPTIHGESLIEKEYETGNCEQYHVLCLFCGDLFVITWDCITWLPGKPETTRCACPNCGGLHEERHKTKMFAEEGFSAEGKAKWIATRESDDPKTVSMHISAFCSPAGFMSWEAIVRKYIKAQGDENKMTAWTNIYKGETYKISGEVPDHEKLYDKREDYQIGIIPKEVYFLTMGADIQKDRIEFEVVGWRPGCESYSIEYRVLPGDTTALVNPVWQDLRDCINHHYESEEGSLMYIKQVCVDSGDGTSTKVVYDFCSSMGNDRVKPIKGMPDSFNIMVGNPKILNTTKGGKKVGSSKVWGVGVSMIKNELYGFLKLNSIKNDDGSESYPAGYCHFPMYNQEFFLMLTAEKNVLVKNKKTGKQKYEWVKERDRNEALDCRVYARAAAYIVGIDRFKDNHFKRIKADSKVFDKSSDPIQKKPLKKKSNFWNR